MGRTQIPDAHWRVMWQIIRKSPRIWKSDEARERAFVEQICWAVRTGVPWAEIPTRFGRALRRRFERWQRHGIWARQRGARIRCVVAVAPTPVRDQAMRT